jgi:hypothetical protein
MRPRAPWQPGSSPQRRMHKRGSQKAFHAIRHAHRCMEAGDFEKASQEFIHLAGAARRRLLPQAPFLKLQAAKAQLKLGREGQALTSIKQALEWLMRDGRWRVLAVLGDRAVDELSASGFIKGAEDIQNYYERKLADIRIPVQLSREVPLPRQFPEKCTYCGGTIEPEDYILFHDGPVSCSYCGSSINYL